MKFRVKGSSVKIRKLIISWWCTKLSLENTPISIQKHFASPRACFKTRRKTFTLRARWWWIGESSVSDTIKLTNGRIPIQTNPRKVQLSQCLSHTRSNYVKVLCDPTYTNQGAFITSISKSRNPYYRALLMFGFMAIYAGANSSEFASSATRAAEITRVWKISTS